MKTTLTIEHGMHELRVEFEFDYEPYDPGVRYHPDGSGCPPSGDYVDVTNAKVLTIGEITREWMEARGWDVKKLDGLIYDLAADSQRGDMIYDALYDAACAEEDWEPDRDDFDDYDDCDGWGDYDDFDYDDFGDYDE